MILPGTLMSFHFSIAHRGLYPRQQFPCSSTVLFNFTNGSSRIAESWSINRPYTSLPVPGSLPVTRPAGTVCSGDLSNNRIHRKDGARLPIHESGFILCFQCVTDRHCHNISETYSNTRPRQAAIGL